MTERKSIYRLGLALSFVFALTAQTSRAGSVEVDLTVTQGANTATFQIFAGSGIDAPGSTPNNLSADVTIINSVLATFGLGDVTFSSLGANSNNPGTFLALINQNALFTVAANSAPVTVSAISFQTDFLSPTGGTGSLQSSSSGTFSNSTPTSVQSFQSWFDQTNLGAMTTPSAVLNFGYNSPANLSQSGTAPVTLVSNVVSPYALVNEINLTVGTATSLTGVSYGGTTILTVTAIPEPSSVLMTMSALPIAFVFVRRFRRGVKSVG
jgi:hypothetical protein